MKHRFDYLFHTPHSTLRAPHSAHSELRTLHSLLRRLFALVVAEVFFCSSVLPVSALQSSDLSTLRPVAARDGGNVADLEKEFWVEGKTKAKDGGDQDAEILKTLVHHESVLARRGFDFNAYQASAEALAEIAKSRPDFIREKTVTALEQVFVRSGLSSYTHQASANALAEIAKSESPLAPKALTALEQVFVRGGLNSYAHQASADALGEIAKSRPDLIRSNTIRTVKSAFERGDSVERVLGILFGIARQRGELFEETAELLGRLRVQRIELTDGGNSPASFSDFSEGFLEAMPEVQFNALPEALPQKKEVSLRDLPSFEELPLPEGSHFAFVLGRTVVFKLPNGRFLAFKVLKRGENPRDLLYESKFFEYLKRNQKTFLRSTKSLF